jgi:hypothetical protein
MTIHQTILELAAKNDSSLYLKWLDKCKHMPSELTPLLELIVLRWQTDISKDEAEEIYVMLLKEFGTNEAPDTKQKVREHLCSGAYSITSVLYLAWRKYHVKKLVLVYF